MDLLAIFPYYIEIALQKDTVSLSPLIPPRLIVLSDALRHITQSTLFRFSILRTFRLLRVFRPFRYNSTLLLCVSLSLRLFGLLMRDRMYSARSRSCSSLSDVRRTHSWRSDSLYSWSSSYSAPFCTCGPFPRYISLAHFKHVKVFYRARCLGRHP